MWKISQLVCLAALIVLSVIDIKIRKIPRALLILGTAGALIYRVFLDDTGLWWITLLGAAAGGIFFIISRITNEGIGYGDSWVVLALGIYLGLWGVLGVLTGAFILLLPVAMYCYIKQKRVGKREKGGAALPFLPFLTGGYVMLLLGMVCE